MQCNGHLFIVVALCARLQSLRDAEGQINLRRQDVAEAQHKRGVLRDKLNVLNKQHTVSPHRLLCKRSCL